MFNHVNFDQDLAGLIPILRGAYEKANIHAGYSDEIEAHKILSNEVEEAFNEIKWIDEILFRRNYYACVPTLEELDEIEARTIRAMCEEVQMLAVCKKMRQMYEREEEK